MLYILQNDISMPRDIEQINCDLWQWHFMCQPVPYQLYFAALLFLLDYYMNNLYDDGILSWNAGICQVLLCCWKFWWWWCEWQNRLFGVTADRLHTISSDSECWISFVLLHSKISLLYPLQDIVAEVSILLLLLTCISENITIDFNKE